MIVVLLLKLVINVLMVSTMTILTHVKLMLILVNVKITVMNVLINGLVLLAMKVTHITTPNVNLMLVI